MASVQDLDRVLTSKGYAIKKTYLTPTQTQQMKTELTMTPKIACQRLAHTVSSFPIYHESKTRWYVPRQWGIRTYGPPDQSIVSEGLPLSSSIEWNASFPPREFQQEIIQSFLDRGSNGLICVPCGYGKTFMALRLAFLLKKRFLIVVDKEFLMNQWRAEIENFMTGVRVGMLQAEKVQMDATQYDVTICMIQTLCRRDFPPGFFDEYGFTIFDECHHLGASYFCKALMKIQTKWMLGLSATPDREDGLTRVFEYYLGEAVYKKTQREPDKEAVVKAVWFHSEDPAYTEVPLNYRGEVVTATLLNQIAAWEPRNQRIMEVMEEYARDPRRFLLILSDRISQLEWFERALQKTPYNWGYYIGGMKQSKLDDNAATCQILLATYHMASEAFSVKKLNTVILATPRKNVQQSTGRIFREQIHERKVAPHIIDVIDSHEVYKRRWWVRQRFYKECMYTIQHVDRKKYASKEEEEEDEEEEKEEEEDEDEEEEEEEEKQEEKKEKQKRIKGKKGKKEKEEECLIRFE